MIKRSSFLILLCGFFIAFILSIYFYHINVMASELVDQAEELKDSINIDIEEDIEDQEETEELTDTIMSISGNDEDQNIQNNSYDDTEDSESDTIQENQTDNDQVMNNDDQFRIMIIFAFGLTIGVIVGRSLLEFIK